MHQRPARRCCNAHVGASVFAQCPGVPVQVVVLTPDPQVVVQQTHDIAGASGNRAAVQSKIPQGWHVTGLAQARPQYEIKLEGQSRPGCYRPTRATIDVGFVGPIQIHISAKYRPGSCEYTNVHGHEMQHAMIYRRSIVSHSSILQYELSQALGLLSDQVKTSPQAQQLVFQIAQGVVDRVFARMMAEAQRYNAALDTVENYKLEQAKCANW